MITGDQRSGSLRQRSCPLNKVMLKKSPPTSPNEKEKKRKYVITGDAEKQLLLFVCFFYPHFPLTALKMWAVQPKCANGWIYEDFLYSPSHVLLERPCAAVACICYDTALCCAPTLYRLRCSGRFKAPRCYSRLSADVPSMFYDTCH